MLRGKINTTPIPVVMVDYRVALEEHHITTLKKLLWRVTANTLLFDSVSKNIPIKKSFLFWCEKNTDYKVVVFVDTPEPWVFDQLLARRLEDTWVSDVVWVESIEEVFKAIRMEQVHIALVASVDRRNELKSSFLWHPTFDMKTLR